jgi:predicted PurR-regulated permease PerM
MLPTPAHRILTLAALVVVVAGLKLAAPLLVPFFAALFLAILTLPLLTWLEQHRVPRVLAVTLAVLFDLLVLGLLGLLLSTSVASFVEAAPRYQAQLVTLIDRLVRALEVRGVPAARWLEEGLFDAASMIDLVGSTLRGVASLFTDLLLVVTTMVFLLLEVSALPAKLHAAFGPQQVTLLWRYARIRLEVQRYLMMKTVVSVVMGVLSWLGVWLVGLDFALLWGVVAFLFNYIPNIGPILAAIPPLLLSMVQLGLGPTLFIAALFLALHLGLGNILEPMLFGRRLGLSALVVWLSLIFWGWVWGPIGMLLSVPLTVIARIVFENSRELRWIALMLSAAPAAEETMAEEPR